MSMKPSYIFSITTLAFLVGCAAPQPTWRKDGVSGESVRTALAECKYQVGLNKISDEKQKEVTNNCMEGKGFRWR